MLAWCGIAIALVVGFHFVPRVVTSFGGTSADDRVTVAVLFLVLVATLGQTAGFGLGVLAHRPSRTARTLPTWDRVHGRDGRRARSRRRHVDPRSHARVREGLVGTPRRAVRRSSVVLDDFSPEQPPQFAALGLTISDAPYPSVLSPIGEPPDDPPPPERPDSLARQCTRRAVDAARARATRAGGSFEEPAGSPRPAWSLRTRTSSRAKQDTTVEDSSGREYEATVVAFDPNLDLALLRVRELNAPALTLADAIPGQTGAAYGHPGGGALDIDARARREDRTH